jgi:hypothetical protein
VKSAKKGIAHAAPQRADLRTLRTPGHVDSVPDRAARRLAQAIHDVESDGAAVSWSAQERAETFYNARGLAATLDEATRLERIIRERQGAS